MMADKDEPETNVTPLSRQAAPRPPQVKSLSVVELIATHRRGDLARALDAAVEQVAGKVRDGENYAPKGKVTLNLTIERDQRGALLIRPAVKLGEPDKLIGEGFYFTTEGGTLTRQDPIQTDLEEFTDRDR